MPKWYCDLPACEAPALRFHGNVDFDRLSEVATYRLLRPTSIPVPSTYDFALDRDQNNPMGVGYILLEKISGQSMDWSQATPDQEKYVFRQLRDVSSSSRKSRAHSLVDLSSPTIAQVQCTLVPVSFATTRTDDASRIDHSLFVLNCTTPVSITAGISL
jgi:hypothetical protein